MKLISKILVLFLVATLASCGVDDEKQYLLSVEETLEAVVNKKDIYSAEKIADIIYKKDTLNYRFIDIRTPHEFIIDHVDGAVNVPAKHILDEEYLEILNQDQLINVLYCKGSHQAMNAYIMLKQLNFKNIKVSLGGFSFIKESIINSYGIKTGIYNDELARYDFSKIQSETQGGGDNIKSVSAAKPKKALIKRKKKEVEGGCG